jgi:hypothetical protein
MRIDSSGNVGIGTSTADFYSTGSSRFLTVHATTSGNYGALNLSGTDAGGLINFGGQTVRDAVILSSASNLIFYTNGTNSGTSVTERMRITSGGYLKASNSGTYGNATGTYHELYNNANTETVVIRNANASFNQEAVVINVDRNTTNNSYYFLRANVPGVGTRMLVADSGAIGTAGGISLGNVTPPTSGIGVQFPATQSASSDANTLDDYEEGTWTPQLKFGGNSVSMTYSVQSGSYTKIGRLVYATCRITLSNKGTSTGSASITGLPFTSGSGNANYSAGAFGYVETVGNGSRWSVLQLPVQDAATTLIMLRYYTGSATSDHNEASFNNNTDFIIFTSYQV